MHGLWAWTCNRLESAAPEHILCTTSYFHDVPLVLNLDFNSHGGVHRGVPPRTDNMNVSVFAFLATRKPHTLCSRHSFLMTCTPFNNWCASKKQHTHIEKKHRQANPLMACNYNNNKKDGPCLKKHRCLKRWDVLAQYNEDTCTTGNLKTSVCI